MTATQAPTPGPLSATDWRVGDYAARLEDHPLVKAGEVHRVTEMFRGGYLGFAPPVGGEWNPRGWGKCDADGWMPWSGGENPVPGQRVQWRTRNEAVRVMSVLSNNLDWTHECRRGFDPIMAFRLAPTAPVEASGSERDVPWLTDDECDEVGKLRFALAMKVYRMSSDLRQNLCPQPSGETREAVARIIDPSAWTKKDEGHPGGENFVKKSLRLTDRILALCPAPVASGGQHSSGEDAAWTWLNGHVECDPADRDYSADEMVDAFMAGAGRYDRWSKALERIAGEHQHRSGYCQTDITVEPALTAEEAQTVARDALSGTPVQSTAPVAETAGEAEQTALNIICDPGIITGLHTAAEARDWIEKSVRAALLSKKKPTSEEVDARRRLINLIEQWDGESEYDAEDIASLADDILHAFNGAPVLSWPALGYVSADAETALKAGINRVIYPAPSAHASFPLYSAPVPAQDDDKLRIPAKWFEVAEYATERGLAVHESNMRMEEFRRVVTPAAVLSVSADEEIK